MENKEKQEIEKLTDEALEQVNGGIKKLSLDPDKENDAPKGAVAAAVIKKIIDT